MVTVSMAGPKQVSHCKPHHSFTMCSTFSSRSCSHSSAGLCIQHWILPAYFGAFMEELSSWGCLWLNQFFGHADHAGACSPGFACCLSAFSLTVFQTS